MKEIGKNYFVSIAVLSAMLFLAAYVFAAGTYSGGDGLSPETAYQIASANDIQQIGANPDDWDKCFILTADIDLSEYTNTSFNIIGNSQAEFVGVFDGRGFTIDNFTYTSVDTNYIGLFGLVGSDGVVKNLGLTNVNIDAGTGSFVAALAGVNAGSLVNCYSTGSVAGGDYVGGLTGNNENTLTNSHANTSVTGIWYVGGLAGCNQAGMTNCYSAGNVYGEWYVGGMVGENFGYGSVSYSYSTVHVYGLYSVGGLVGLGSENSEIFSCYSTGDVDGSYSIGGLIGGISTNAAVANCYSTGFVCGDLYVGGFIGYNNNTVKNCYFLDPAGPDNCCGIPLSAELMKQRAVFVDWDFDPYDGNGRQYWINEGADFPRLYWQSIGDLDNDGIVNLSDLAIMSAAWQTNQGEDNYNSICNLSGETTIDTEDLAVLIGNWLQGTTP